MQRRTFLTFAGVAAVAVGADKPPIGIGFLGAVHSHFDGKLAAVRSIADFRIIGISESDPKAQASLRKSGIALLARDQLLNHPDIQVVAVESAVRDHAADGLSVLKAGKHLHLEKAPADSMKAFQQIADVARKKNLRLQVGYIYRHHPGIEKAIEAARKGWLGRVYLVRANIGNQLAANRRPEWAEFAGGVMFELGGHVIDPVARLMGRPLRVEVALRKDGNFDDTLKDNTVALIEWKNATGIVQSATLQPGATRYRAFEVFGTNGSFVVNPLEPGGAFVDLEKAGGPYLSGRQKVELGPFRRYETDLRDLVAAVREEAELPVTIEEELAVQEVLLRCSGMYELKP
ncbi:MAG: Gfo/Idh/MocA family oxidoreductase [Bryobacteraceae bacterium]